MRHPGVSHAIRLEAGGRTLTFSGDTGVTPALGAHARGADILLCEATYADGAASDDVHLSAADAGRAATEAGAGRLVLVHVDADKRPAAVAAAQVDVHGSRRRGGPRVHDSACSRQGMLCGGSGSPSAAADTAHTIAAREASFER